jgi:hypothetical protein
MVDVALEWRPDFLIDTTGDLLVIDGDDELRQRSTGSRCGSTVSRFFGGDI